MKVGIAGPISLNLLKGVVQDGETMNDGYSFPMTSHLALELLERGHQVVVFALDPGISKPVRYSGDSITIVVSPFRPRARDRALDFFRAEREYLVQAMTQEVCGLIHAHWSYEFALAARQSGTRYLVTVHDWAPAVLRMHRDAYRAIRFAMNVKAIATSTTFTANSPYIAEKLRSWRPGASITLVPNAVPNQFFRGRAHVRPSVLSIGCVSSGFGRLKNTASLLRAFRAIRSRVPNAELSLVGDGHEVSGPAHLWAAEHGLDQGVAFLGRLDSALIPGFLEELSVYVHPSLEESFGIAIAEAMAMGVPVVAGRHSGAVPWLLEHGQAGLLVDVESDESIAEAVIGLHSHEPLWDKFSESGFQRASRSFRLPIVTDKYESIYRGLS